MSLVQKIIASGAKGMAAIAAAGVLAASCGGYEVKSGQIYEKVYEPERRWVSIIPMGKVFIPVVHYDDEDFVLKVRTSDPETGKYHAKSFYVDRQAYGRFNVGDFYIANGNEDVKDGVSKMRRR